MVTSMMAMNPSVAGERSDKALVLQVPIKKVSFFNFFYN
jgi:hypothetical protein